MKHALVTLALVGVFAAPGRAAPSAPAASELCALALANRPTEQLQERQTCTVVQTKVVPVSKGSAMRRVVVLRVPLNDGDQDLLLIEVAAGGKSAWQDIGPIGGQSGGLGGLRIEGALESLEVRATTSGPRLVVGAQYRRELTEARGTSIVTRHEWLVCGAERELVCVSVADRAALEVQGDVPDLVPYRWTRTVALDAAGAITISARDGTGELGPFDPGPGTHPLTALADKPLVRRYPVVPNVHPDALKEDPPLALPE